MSDEEPRVLVVGLGGIGGVVSAHLIEQGAQVTPLTTNPAIADAIEAHGYRVTEDGEERVVRGPVARVLSPDTEPFDVVLLATQPPQVESAAEAARPFLSPTGTMVCRCVCGFISRFMRARRSAIRAVTVGSSSSRIPSSSAVSSRVMSSLVGPSPPVTTTMSARPTVSSSA